MSEFEPATGQPEHADETWPAGDATDAMANEDASDVAAAEDPSETGSAIDETEPSQPEAHESPVAAAMSELDQLAELDVSEHPAVYQRIHSELQSALTSIDDA
jgi:hypothetical protein